MFRKMQYLAVIALVAMICIQTSSAQTEATASVGASASIFSALTTNVVAAVEFANIATGQIPYIAPTLAKSSTNWPYAGAGAVIGNFTISGQTGEKVTLTVATTVLTGSVSGSIDYLPELSSGSSQVGSTPITSGSTQVTLVAGPPSATIWVGGHLYQHSTTSAVPSAQAAGTYSGTAVITVDYVL